MEDFAGRDINAVFTLGLKKDIENNEDNEDTSKEDQYKNKNFLLREININNRNIFKNPNNLQKIEIIQRCPVSPCYYKDYNCGAYAIAIINKSLEFQFFDRDDMLFIFDLVNQGKLLRKKINKEIDEDNIINLDLSRNKLSSIDFQYLSSFALKNLKILDLESNSIGIQGDLFLSKGKFSV